MSEPGTAVPAGRVPLDERAVRDEVTRARPWRELVVVAETASTNDDVARLARAAAAEGVVVVAEHQTAGRGRLSREWVSPPYAGITFSALVRPAVPVERWPWLPLLAGLATARAVAATGGVDARVKWPNDVLVGGRKVAGLLAEVVDGAVVIGVGINVSTTRAELPRADASSVSAERGSAVDRGRLLCAVLRRLGEDYLAWQAAADGGAALRASYLERCDTVGRNVRVDVPGVAPVVGRAVDVDALGRLVVATPDGSVALSAGDVQHVRATD